MNHGSPRLLSINLTGALQTCCPTSGGTSWQDNSMRHQATHSTRKQTPDRTCRPAPRRLCPARPHPADQVRGSHKKSRCAGPSRDEHCWRRQGRLFACPRVSLIFVGARSSFAAAALG